MALAFYRGKYALGLLLFAVFIFSFLYHNLMHDSEILGKIDVYVASFTSLVFATYIMFIYKPMDVYKISALAIAIIGFGVYFLGKTNDAIYASSHNLFHVFEAIAAFIILLPAAPSR